MSISIPLVDEVNIKHCILIDLTVNTSTYYISNAYSPITYNGNTYTQLGHLMGISEMQDDLKATNNQITVALSGIPPDDGSPNYMTIALNSNLKGSSIKIYRAFFDSETLSPTNVYLRFKGYVNNFSLNENWDQDNKLVSNTISVQCSNINAVIEKQFSGRRTNDGDQQYWFPGDTGMSRVKSLVDAQFDFGKTT